LFPPSSESAGEEQIGSSRARSASQPSSFRRQPLSLNISALPAYFQDSSLISPNSYGSSSAPFTDSFSVSNGINLGQDYFHFDEASLPSSNGEVFPGDFTQINHQFGYRLPASQPSSPVRSVYPPGQAPVVLQQGRQRGATFSGGSFSPFGEQMNGQNAPAPRLAQPPQSAAPPSAIPAHMTFNPTQPISSSPPTASLVSNPVAQIDQATSSQFLNDSADMKVDIGMGEVLMGEMITPIPPATASGAVTPSRRTSSQSGGGNGTLTPDMSLDKLSILDQ